MRYVIAKKLFLGVLALSGAALVSPSCAADPIKIAVIAPTSGPWAALGQEALRGVEIARDVQNAKGGINGRPIELLVADAPTTKAAVAETERLINVDGVNVVVPAMISAVSQAVAPVAERKGKISWHLNASTDLLTQQGFKHLFRTSGYGSNEGTVMVEFTRDHFARAGKQPKDVRVAIVFEDGVYGSVNAEASKVKATELGMQIVLYEGYNRSTQDLSSTILKLKEANPDVVMLTSYAPDTKILLTEAASLKFKPNLLVLTGGAIGSDWFNEAFGDRVNGFIATNWPIENTSPELAPGLAEFVKLYKKKTGRQTLYSAHSATAYTGMLILWDVLSRASSVSDPEAIRKAAEATDIPINTIGIGWGAKFAPPGDPMMGTNLRAGVVVTQWQDGERWTIWPVPYPGRNIVPIRSSVAD